MKVGRRGFMALATVAGAELTPRAVAAGLRDVRVVDLRADGLAEPVGLEAAPRLSWRVEAEGDWRQGAYRIGVASSAAAARAGRYDLWDSGRVADDRQLDIVYLGQGRGSGERAWWRVELWDGSGKRVAPSEVASWEMGLLAATDWTARWIEAEDPATRRVREEGIAWIWGAEAVHDAPRRFRWRFATQAAGEAALQLAAKDDLRGLWLDGVSVLPARVPPWGTGPRFPLGHLTAGEHVLAVEVKLRTDEPRPVIGGALAAVLEMGGERRRSGADWRTALDAPEGWQAAAFDDAAWERARPAAIVPPCHPWPSGPAVRVRRKFRIDAPLARATLRITALGAYEASINGARVGTALLAPEPTDFRRRALYQTYDVTDLLRVGENVIGATVADGHFASPFSFLDLRYCFGEPPRRLLAQLDLVHAHGRRQTIGTDEAWRLGPSPVRFAEIYDGETHDARLDGRGWDSPGFDDAGWQAVQIGVPPDYRPTPQVSPPIRAHEALAPVRTMARADGRHIVDFGQNFAGWCRLKVRGRAGDEIRLRFAEALTSAGDLDTTSNRRAAATDRYILSGDPDGETWEPRFTYHGFRYVEVDGLRGPPATDTLTGMVVHSDLAETARVTTASATVNGIARAARWSQRSNFVGVPTDCPQRDERMGWTGDAQIFWDAACFGMDVAAFTRRFLDDLRAGQLPTGEGADVAPYWARGQNTPGWADALVILPWTAWQRYGDTAVIDRNWTAMTRFAERVAELNPDGLWQAARGMNYGDWLSVDARSRDDETTPKTLVATAYRARSAAMLAQMAAATGRDAEAAQWRAAAARVGDAFRAAFVGADGRVGNDSQTSHVLALHFGLLPDRLRAASVARLAADVRRRGTRLSTGFIGTPYLLDALADGGEEDLAVALLLQTAPPSWGAMVAGGATTMWERWDGVRNGKVQGSLNHYAFGAVTGFFYRRLAGIDVGAPGFARVRVRPLVSAGLAGAAATYDAPVGRVASAWTRTGERVTLDVAFPANTRAEVHLATSRPATIRVDGASPTLVRSVAGVTKVDLPSGQHRIVHDL